MKSESKKPYSAELINGIKEDLPELQNIQDAELREKCIEAWAYALSESSFNRIREIQGAGNPNQLVLKEGTQADHLRGVATMAMYIVDEFTTRFPQVEIDRDIVLAGALCHDVGKPWEFDPKNIARWDGDPSEVGQPSLRHSVYGAHICLTVGLPEKIAHIALGHSVEGQHIGLSTECAIVRNADHMWWTIAAVLGLLKPESFFEFLPKYIRPRER